MHNMPMNHLILAILSFGMTPTAEVDFDVDVIPILTKAGCNAAACHGSAAGRGGFNYLCLAATQSGIMPRSHTGWKGGESICPIPKTA